MNPDDLAVPVRAAADRMFRLPEVVLPELLDAISFEDTESALSRLLGGYLPAAGARHVVTGPGGAPEARSGDVPPVRFGHPRPNRTGREHPAPPVEPPGVKDAFTASSAAKGSFSAPAPPVTRLTQGVSGLADVLRVHASAGLPDGPAGATSPSIDDFVVRPGANPVPVPEAERPVSADLGHREPGGPGHDASGPTHLGPAPATDDSWPEEETDALAGAVLDRLLDQAELDLHRSYGLGEW